MSQRLVRSYSVEVRAGMNQIQLDLGTLPAGTYLARSTVNGLRSTVKVVKW